MLLVRALSAALSAALAREVRWQPLTSVGTGRVCGVVELLALGGGGESGADGAANVGGASAAAVGGGSRGASGGRGGLGGLLRGGGAQSAAQNQQKPKAHVGAALRDLSARRVADGKVCVTYRRV